MIERIFIRITFCIGGEYNFIKIISKWAILQQTREILQWPKY